MREMVCAANSMHPTTPYALFQFPCPNHFQPLYVYMYRDAWYAQQGLSRTDAKRRYITTLINTMHRYASQTPEALELVAELEFVWDQVKSNFVASPVSSSHSHSQSHPHQSVGVPPFPGAQHQQQIMGGSGSASGSRSGSGRYRRNNHGHKKHAGKDLKLRVLSPVSQPDEQYQRVFRFPNEHGGADYEDVDADVDVDVEGQEEQFEDDDVHPDEYEGGDGEEEDKVEEEPEDEEEEEYEEAPDGSYRSDEKNHSDSNGNNDNDNDNNDGDDGYLHQNRGQNPKQRRKRRALGQDGNDNGNGSEHAVTHQNNTTTDTNENTLQPRLWRRRVEQALTKMTAEVAAVREQMETRAVVQRRRNGVWAWFKWIIWVAVRQVIWDVGMLGLLLIYMRARGDRRVERRLRDGWAEVRARVMRLALLRGRLPFGL